MFSALKFFAHQGMVFPDPEDEGGVIPPPPSNAKIYTMTVVTPPSSSIQFNARAWKVF